MLEIKFCWHEAEMQLNSGENIGAVIKDGGFSDSLLPLLAAPRRFRKEKEIQEKEKEKEKEEK